MAVMVSLADGVYSLEEDQKLQQFCLALHLEDTVLNSVRSTLYVPDSEEIPPGLKPPTADSKLDPLKPARDWLDQLEVQDPRLARFVCKLIPSQCPFERDVVLFKKSWCTFPPCANSIRCMTNWWACGFGRYRTWRMSAARM